MISLPPSCFLCHRSKPIKDGTYVRVTFDGDVQLLCDDCFEKGNENRDLDEEMDLND